MPDANILGQKPFKGPTYKSLKPEVKQTIDKMIYQLDLCRNTLSLLENRITINESRLLEVVDYIKTEDFSFVSTFCNTVAIPHREGRLARDSRASQ